MVNFPEIPGYKIIKELGKGGMARVYLAREEKLDREVALKFLLRSLTEEESLTTRFIKEAKTAAQLRHSGIVSIFDVGQFGEDVYYFAMEFLEMSLKDKIHRHPISSGLDPREALKIVVDIAKALDYAHRKGIIHRDIKPDNIMFREDGTTVLVDFGIARAIGSSTKLTKSGTSIGTPHYMSPEQVRGKVLDGRSDIYSLGVVLFEMLTSKIPYDAEDSVAIALQHVSDPIPKLPAKLSRYQNIIDSMMAKNPDDRPKNSTQLIDLMEMKKIDSKANIKYTEELSDITPAASIIPETKREYIPPHDPERVPLIKSDNRSKTIKFLLSSLIIVVGILVIYLIFDSKQRDVNNNKVEKKQVHKLENKSTETMVKEPVGKSKEESKDPTPIQNSTVQDQKFNKLLAESQQNVKEGDYPKALARLKEAKKIKSTDTLLSLENQVNKKIQEEKDQKYNGYLQEAQQLFERGNLNKAKQSIVMAKKIKSDFRLNELEQNIKNKIIEIQEKQKNEEYLRKQRELEKTRQLEKKKREEMKREEEKKREEARIKKEAELKKLTPKQVNLRSFGKELSSGEVKSMIRRFGFFDNYDNRTGDFQNKFQLKTINGDNVVIDSNTDLMWHQSGSSSILSFEKAIIWIKGLNDKQYAGCNDWRLPTLEEGASLLERTQMNTALYIDSIFSNTQRWIWTSDTNGSKGKWIVYFIYGDVRRDFVYNVNCFVRPVRSAKK